MPLKTLIVLSFQTTLKLIWIFLAFYFSFFTWEMLIWKTVHSIWTVYLILGYQILEVSLHLWVFEYSFFLYPHFVPVWDALRLMKVLSASKHTAVPKTPELDVLGSLAINPGIICSVYWIPSLHCSDIDGWEIFKSSFCLIPVL